MPLPFDDMDYGQLARIAQPQMMGNAPVGGGATAGLDFALQRNRQNDLLERASQQAALMAQMKAMAADEYGQGHSGRLADIQYSNGMSAAKLGSLDDDMQTQRTESKRKLTAAQRAQLEEEMGKLGDYARTYVNASPEGKQAVKDLMKQNGINKILGKDIDNIPDDKFDGFMQGAFKRQVNTPAQAQKMDVEKAKEQTAVNRAAMTGQMGILREQLKQEASTERTRMNIEAKLEAAKLAKEGKESTKKWVEKYYDKVDAGTNTDREDAIYRTIQINQERTRAAGIEAKPAEVDLKKMTQGAIPTTKPVVDAPTSMPSGAPNFGNVSGGSSSSSAAPKASYDETQHVYKDASGKATEVMGVSRDGTRLQLKDGSIVPNPNKK